MSESALTSPPLPFTHSHSSHPTSLPSSPISRPIPNHTRRHSLLLLSPLDQDNTHLPTDSPTIYPTPLSSLGIGESFPGLVGGGPFPRFLGSGHSEDPYGLNRFLGNMEEAKGGESGWGEGVVQEEEEGRVRDGGKEGGVSAGVRETQPSSLDQGHHHQTINKSSSALGSGGGGGGQNSRNSKMARTKSPLGLPPLSPEQMEEPFGGVNENPAVVKSNDGKEMMEGGNKSTSGGIKFGRATLKLKKSASSFSVLKAKASSSVTTKGQQGKGKGQVQGQSQSSPPSSFSPIIVSLTPSTNDLPPSRTSTMSSLAPASRSTLSLQSSSGGSINEENAPQPPFAFGLGGGAGSRNRQSSLDLATNSRSPSAHSLASSLISTMSGSSSSDDPRDGIVTPMESENGQEKELEIRIEGGNGEVENGIVTEKLAVPSIRNKADQVKKIVKVEKPKRDVKTPTSTGSGWKTWFGGKKSGGKESKPAQLPTARPKTVQQDTSRRLSADLLAGVLPGSLNPLAAASIAAEKLHLEEKSPKPIPEPVQLLRATSISKLSALRAPSPHPIVASSQLPGYLSLDGMRNRSSSNVASLKYPRSQNAYVLPGMGLGPAEAGMRIDVVVRGLIKRIDGGSFSMNDIQTCSSALSMEQKMENRFNNKRQRERSFESKGTGVMLFTTRPTFESRCHDYRMDGIPRPVETAGNRALYDIEFSSGLQALADEMRDGKLTGMPIRPRPQTLPALKLSSFSKGSNAPRMQHPHAEDQDQDRDEYGSAEDNTPTPTQATPTSNSTPSFPRPSSTASLPEAAAAADPPTRKVSLRRPSMPELSPVARPSLLKSSNRISLRPVTFNAAWDTDSDDSESEEDEVESGEEGLVFGGGGRASKSMPTSQSMDRTMTDSSQKQGMNSEEGKGPREDPKRLQHKRQSSQPVPDYRGEVAKARERRENSRSGQIERQSASEMLAKAYSESKVKGGIAVAGASSKQKQDRPISSTHRNSGGDAMKRLSSCSAAGGLTQSHSATLIQDYGRSMSQQSAWSSPQMQLGSPGSPYSSPIGYGHQQQQQQPQMMYFPVMMPYTPYMTTPMNPYGIQQQHQQQHQHQNYLASSLSANGMNQNRPLSGTGTGGYRSRPTSMSFDAGSGSRMQGRGDSVHPKQRKDGRSSPIQ